MRYVFIERYIETNRDLVGREITAFEPVFSWRIPNKNTFNSFWVKFGYVLSMVLNN